MDKLAMMSIIIATIAAPAIAARDPKPRRGAMRMIVFLLVFNAFYITYITVIHARFYVPVR